MSNHLHHELARHHRAQRHEEACTHRLLALLRQTTQGLRRPAPRLRLERRPA